MSGPSISATLRLGAVGFDTAGKAITDFRRQVEGSTSAISGEMDRLRQQLKVDPAVFDKANDQIRRQQLGDAANASADRFTESLQRQVLALERKAAAARQGAEALRLQAVEERTIARTTRGGVSASPERVADARALAAKQAALQADLKASHAILQLEASIRGKAAALRGEEGAQRAANLVQEAGIRADSEQARRIRELVGEENRLQRELAQTNHQQGLRNELWSRGRQLAAGLLATIGLSAGVSQAVDLGRTGVDALLSLERIKGTLGTAFAGDQKRAAEEFAFVRQEAERLNIELPTAAQNLAQIQAAARGSALAGQPVREIFLGISEASVGLKLSQEATAGALTAVTQIIAKQKVSAEELRGQLGERMPIALIAATEAVREHGESFGDASQRLNKMLETGKLLATDFLPRFAVELRKLAAGGLEENIHGLQGTLNNLSNKKFEFRVAVGEGLEPSLREVTDRLAGWLEENRELAQGLGEDLGTALELVSGAALLAAENIGVLKTAGAAALVAWAVPMALKLPGLAAATVSWTATLGPAGVAMVAMAAAGVALNAVINDYKTSVDRAMAGIVTSANFARQVTLDLRADLEDGLVSPESIAAAKVRLGELSAEIQRQQQLANTTDKRSVQKEALAQAANLRGTREALVRELRRAEAATLDLSQAEKLAANQAAEAARKRGEALGKVRSAIAEEQRLAEERRRAYESGGEAALKVLDRQREAQRALAEQLQGAGLQLSDLSAEQREAEKRRLILAQLNKQALEGQVEAAKALASQAEKFRAELEKIPGGIQEIPLAPTSRSNAETVRHLEAAAGDLGAEALSQRMREAAQHVREAISTEPQGLVVATSDLRALVDVGLLNQREAEAYVAVLRRGMREAAAESALSLASGIAGAFRALQGGGDVGGSLSSLGGLVGDRVSPLGGQVGRLVGEVLGGLFGSDPSALQAGLRIGLNATGFSSVGAFEVGSAAAGEIVGFVEDALEQIQRIVGSSLQGLGEVEIRPAKDQSRFQVLVEGVVFGMFDNLEEAVGAALGQAGIRAQLGAGAAPEVAQMLRTLHVGDTIGDLIERLELGRLAADLRETGGRVSPLRDELRQLRDEFTDLFRQFRENGLDTQFLEQSFFGGGLTEVRNRLLGIEDSAQAIFNQGINDYNAFFAQFLADLQVSLAALQQEQAALLAEAGTVSAEVLSRAGEVGARLVDGVNIVADGMSNSAFRLAQINAQIDSAQRQIAQLTALGPISPEEAAAAFRRQQAGRQAAREREGFFEDLDRRERDALPGVASQLASLGVEYDALLEQARRYGQGEERVLALRLRAEQELRQAVEDRRRQLRGERGDDFARRAAELARLRDEILADTRALAGVGGQQAASPLSDLLAPLGDIDRGAMQEVLAAVERGPQAVLEVLRQLEGGAGLEPLIRQLEGLVPPEVLEALRQATAGLDALGEAGGALTLPLDQLQIFRDYLEGLANLADEAIGSLGLPLESLRDQSASFVETMAFLRQQFEAGVISAERWGQVQREATIQVQTSILETTASLLEQAGKEGAAQEVRARLAELRYQLDIASLRIQVELALQLGVLSSDVLGILQRAEAALDGVDIGAIFQRQQLEEALGSLGITSRQVQQRLAEFRAGLEALQQLYESGEISQRQYADELAEATAGARAEVLELAAGLLERMGRDREAAELRAQLEELRFRTELIQLEILVRGYVAVGRLSREWLGTVARIQAAVDGFDFSAALRAGGAGTSRSGGGGGASAGDSVAEALRRLAAEEGGGDGLRQAIDGVVERFGSIVRVLGPTERVLAAFRESMARAVDQQLRGLDALEERILFGDRSPLRGVERAALAQQEFDAAFAALQAGDFSGLDDFDGVAQRLLEQLDSVAPRGSVAALKAREQVLAAIEEARRLAREAAAQAQPVPDEAPDAGGGFEGDVLGRLDDLLAGQREGVVLAQEHVRQLGSLERGVAIGAEQVRQGQLLTAAVADQGAATRDTLRQEGGLTRAVLLTQPRQPAAAFGFAAPPPGPAAPGRGGGDRVEALLGQVVSLLQEGNRERSMQHRQAQITRQQGFSALLAARPLGSLKAG